VDWVVLEKHLRAAHAASRVGAGPAAEPNALKVDAARVAAYRASAMHLQERIGSLTDAAHAGLQDSAPRAGLLSLHARTNDVGPASWEDPSLVQIWFRLGADYVIPRADFGVFTLGALPRDDAVVKAFDELGSLVARTTGGAPTRTRDLEAALPDLPNRFLIRQSVLSGRVAIRWDARTTEVIPVERPEIDLEEARRELARRFLHWLGPASAMHFARWAAVPKKEAARTFEAIGKELVPVDVEGRAASILALDEHALAGAAPAVVVRLLPFGDPYLYLDAPTVPKVPDGVPTRVVNSLGGRIFVDGDVVGAWARKQADVTLFGWSDDVPRDRVEAEAHAMRGPLGRDVRVGWLD
jgi:hypothetical protein